MSQKGTEFGTAQKAGGLPRLELPESLPSETLALVTLSQAREFQVLPLGRSAGGALILACANLSAAAARIAELEFVFGAVELCLADSASFHAHLSRSYGVECLPVQKAPQPLGSASVETPQGVAAYVDTVLDYAMRVGASDVHFEPFGTQFRVRLRVDGMLKALPALPERAGAAVLARLKILAGLDLGKSRTAQDGRIRRGRGADLRLATLPTVGGECAVLRLLDRGRASQSLAELGMPAACRAELERVCAGQGLVLACGPTGSGKTTTLHAALRLLNAAERKILTIEDPVEYELSGAVQVQARPEIGLGFARALRSFLRHDPDVILVGEIRDAETARIALRAAITGHLVLASLHCSDAPQAPLRLVDLGLEPWLVGSALELAIAQRLLRKAQAEDGPQEGGGRVAVYEWLRMSPALAAKLDAADMSDYLSAARKAMTCTMAQVAQDYAGRGLVNPSEVCLID